MSELSLRDLPLQVGATGGRTAVATTFESYINLDANANARTTRVVEAAVVDAMRSGAANPSSTHRSGERARSILERARDHVASLVEGAFAEDVVFTSGCTESNNTVMAGVAASDGCTLITSVVEHPSIMRPAAELERRGYAVRYVPVDRNGWIRLDVLDDLLVATSGPVVLSIQGGNSETGVIQPIELIAGMVAEREDVLFHSDAAQSFGRVPVDLGGRGADVLSLSGHKIHAPMGVGALLVSASEERLIPLLLGGSQEANMRAGTQAIPSIAGFGAACAARRSFFESDIGRMRTMRDRLESAVIASVPSATVNGAESDRLPNTSNMQFPGTDGMALVALLDDAGLAVSQMSACSSARPRPSHVLLAMGLAEGEASASVRFSVSPTNSIDEIDRAADIIVDVVRSGRANHGF